MKKRVLSRAAVLGLLLLGAAACTKVPDGIVQVVPLEANRDGELWIEKLIGMHAAFKVSYRGPKEWLWVYYEVRRGDEILVAKTVSGTLWSHSDDAVVTVSLTEIPDGPEEGKILMKTEYIPLESPGESGSANFLEGWPVEFEGRGSRIAWARLTEPRVTPDDQDIPILEYSKGPVRTMPDSSKPLDGRYLPEEITLLVGMRLLE